jgi:hypothetical protein
MRTWLLAAGVAVGMSAGASVARAQVDAAQGKPAQPVQPGQPPQGQQAPMKFDHLVRRDADGKVVRLEGFVDVIALHVNELVDAAAWERCAPLIDEWVTDTDRSVIDNLDFVEELDRGVLGTLDLMDQNSNRRVMEMMMQFIAIGPLTAFLETRGGLTRPQAQHNTAITNEYYQQMLNEVRDTTQRQFADLPDEARQAKIIHAQSAFIYQMMSRDAMASYDRQLDILAPNFAKIAAALALDPGARAQVDGLVSSIRDAQPGPERRKVVKAALAALPFDQRREVLTRSLAMTPKFDPRTAYSQTVAGLKGQN